MMFLFLQCDYCVYHYKSTDLVSLYTLDIGLQINIIIIIIGSHFAYKAGHSCETALLRVFNCYYDWKR